MNQGDAKQFYEERKIPRYGFLQTSKRRLFTEFAKQGKTDPQFSEDLTTLGNHIARLHKEAATTNKTDAFKQKAIELIKHHETTMTKGASAKDALRRLNRHFKAPTLKEFLKQTAVAAVKEKPTSSKPEAKALKAAPVSLPRVRRKPGLLRHALGLTTLGALLAFGVPYAAKQLSHSTTPTLQSKINASALAPRPPTDTSLKPPDNTAKASKPAAAALTPQSQVKPSPPTPKNRSDAFLKRADSAAKEGELDTAASILESGLKAGALTQEDVSKAFLQHADKAAKAGRMVSAAWILNSGVKAGALVPRDLSGAFLQHADSAANAGSSHAVASILSSGVEAGALTSAHSGAFLKHADSAAKAGWPDSAAWILESGVKAGALTSAHSNDFRKHADSAVEAGRLESAALILEAAGKLHLKSGGKAGLASAEGIVDNLRSDVLKGHGRVAAELLLQEILKRKAKN